MESPLWPYPRVVAHKGGGDIAPENTIYGIDTAVKFGIHSVEFDTMLSSDQVPMLMHDDELARTAIDPIYADKNMNDYAAAELKDIDVGSYFDAKLSHVRIPTLEEVIAHCIAKKIFMNIEIKPAKGHDLRTGTEVTELVSRYFDQLQEVGVAPLFSSFSIDALRAAKEINADIGRGWIFETVPQDEFPDTWKKVVVDLELVSLHVNAKYVTQDIIQEIHEVGCAVFCYTVNDLKQADELLKLGVSCICTDKVEMFGALARKL
mmetsp:Transcript_7958/g.13211  ORF Transcript_7958/g.13211 Transcript_7958/m.13211 type:complete len:263 (+) Transcript_7958:77-865(+)|eukprot:CAMPEP_0174982788 /NCGR_PEP_ID=MMETSP0004_2-20121128/16732_1 /TAXON_ID=420556 /ORGANISM="Ochromonas sp., Strain CCMP1393" /LENGTH=262 /DNA_ID=CAMNT_0016234867 /DNA_START=74 /DNA_END=862 /DNA_ORIENTATION=+